MAIDKKTIGVTAANAAALAGLTDRGHFGSELDAAKFAMGHAIRSGIRPGSSEGTETKWNVGSVDPDGSLRSLIEALFPEVTEPYRAAEYLINEGIKDLASGHGSTHDVYTTLFPTRGASRLIPN